jgi:hypothetical protein
MIPQSGVEPSAISAPTDPLTLFMNALRPPRGRPNPLINALSVLKHPLTLLMNALPLPRGHRNPLINAPSVPRCPLNPLINAFSARNGLPPPSGDARTRNVAAADTNTRRPLAADASASRVNQAHPATGARRSCMGRR